MTPGSLSKNAEKMEFGMRLILSKLELSGAFRGKPLLRRKAWGYYLCSSGYIHLKAGNRWRAARLLSLSLIGYPFPYRKSEVRYSLGRLKLLAAALLTSFRPAQRNRPDHVKESSDT
jgi:hypothetical protein